MIDAKEVRIGNYIHDGSEIRIVDGEDIYNIEDGNNYHKNNIEHFTHEWSLVPITEKLLRVKMGFAHVTDIYEIETYILTTDKPDFFLSKNFNPYLDGVAIKCKTVYYMHQLQNLFFALTGEELKRNY